MSVGTTINREMVMESTLANHQSWVAAHNCTFRHGAAHHGAKSYNGAGTDLGSRGENSTGRNPSIRVNANWT